MKSKKRKLTDIEIKYNKAYSQLKSAITRVENEGFEAFKLLPKKVMRPTLKSINKLLNLKALVLEQSFKVDNNGNKISRLKYKEAVRKEKERLRKTNEWRNELLQGEKVLTKSMQREYLSDMRDSIRDDLYGKDLADMRGIIDTVMDSFFILKDPKYKAQTWIGDYEKKFVDWVENATPETIQAAKNRINWNKFMIQFYDSEGPGRGLFPFLKGMMSELAKLVAIIPTNSNDYESMSYADKLGAGLL